MALAWICFLGQWALTGSWLIETALYEDIPRIYGSVTFLVTVEPLNAK